MGCIDSLHFHGIFMISLQATRLFFIFSKAPGRVSSVCEGRLEYSSFLHYVDEKRFSESSGVAFQRKIISNCFHFYWKTFTEKPVSQIGLYFLQSFELTLTEAQTSQFLLNAQYNLWSLPVGAPE